MRFLSATIGLLASSVAAQQPFPVVLTIDVDNAVLYRSDIADPARRGADASVTTPGAARAFTDILYIGDVVAVNGMPAKGLWTSRQYMMNFSPTPAAGFAVADVNRGAFSANCNWEILDSEGRFVGSIIDAGLSPHGVVSGTGAFYGVQGQMVGGTSPNPRPIRVASMSEDPGLRRVLGGGTARIIFHLLPLYRPEVQTVLHGADFSPVTLANPAKAGETLILGVTGLGPLVPGTMPPTDEPFTELTEVNSPVEATVNGKSAVVLNKLAWRGSTGVYRVDVRVPDGIAPGTAVAQLTAAWVPGKRFQFPVR